MFGTGILKGLGVTLKHFVGSYVDDIRWLGRRYFNDEALKVRQGPKGTGVFTVQYPEEKLPVPEEFRFIPFLVYDEGAEGQREIRCTSCGLCSEYCPFDAIKMDHVYELASFHRHAEHIFNMDRLLQPASYYASIRPTNYAREEAARAEKEAAKAARKHEA